MTCRTWLHVAGIYLLAVQSMSCGHKVGTAPRAELSDKQNEKNATTPLPSLSLSVTFNGAIVFVPIKRATSGAASVVALTVDDADRTKAAPLVLTFFKQYVTDRVPNHLTYLQIAAGQFCGGTSGTCQNPLPAWLTVPQQVTIPMSGVTIHVSAGSDKLDAGGGVSFPNNLIEIPDLGRQISPDCFPGPTPGCTSAVLTFARGSLAADPTAKCELAYFAYRDSNGQEKSYASKQQIREKAVLTGATFAATELAVSLDYPAGGSLAAFRLRPLSGHTDVSLTLLDMPTYDVNGVGGAYKYDPNRSFHFLLFYTLDSTIRKLTSGFTPLPYPFHADKCKEPSAAGKPYCSTMVMSPPPASPAPRPHS
jgi:hypothetical protein